VHELGQKDLYLESELKKLQKKVTDLQQEKDIDVKKLNEKIDFHIDKDF
jgi:uncharacterized protein YlxW (UPF0749 family)